MQMCLATVVNYFPVHIDQFGGFISVFLLAYICVCVFDFSFEFAVKS